jgi:hypothetical protein
MRDKKTLFVLGAGASKPFGFPLGDELRDEIISKPKIGWWLRQCGFREDECDNFRFEFKRSGFSIDAFLARRAEFDKIGRVAISAALVPHEQDDALYFADGRPGWSDWYQSLWKSLVGNALDATELLDRRFRSITFNYDRSLERYLHLTVMSSFGLDAAKGYEVVKSFFPYHVYGQLGPYESDTSFRREPTDVSAAASNLKVMPSARPTSDDQCKALFSWADEVYFLGFAFDAMNCARLGLAETLAAVGLASGTQPNIHATGVGINYPDETRAASMRVTGSETVVNFCAGESALAAMRRWGPRFT